MREEINALRFATANMTARCKIEKRRSDDTIGSNKPWSNMVKF